MRTTPLALLCLSLFTACSNVELCYGTCDDATPSVVDNAVRVGGDACTVAPASVTFPYKILFVIDYSGSNRTSDPQGKRADAVQQVIEQYATDPSVSFGVIRFSEVTERLTPTFTQDTTTLLNDVVPKLRETRDGTDYITALAETQRFLDDDMRSLSAGELARTRYDIQFLSDGEPQPCIPVQTVKDAAVAVMNEKLVFHPFDLRISTTRLNYTKFKSGCSQGDPSDFLKAIADAGGGTFQDLVANLLAFKIAFTEILRKFDTRDFYIVNMNRVVYEDQIWADSDADGIRDLDDPNPLFADVDGDGCSDRTIEALLPNQGLCEDQCRGASKDDKDADGIPDCAELALGYDATAADSDSDGFPDDLELKIGTNPLDGKTASADTDLDGVTDAQELRFGTNPAYPESNHDWQYIYSALTPRKAPDDGTNCFNFDVGNMRLVETLATPRSAAGDNIICLYMLQTVSDDPESIPTVTKTCSVVNFRHTSAGDAKTPADGNVDVSPSDFAMAYQ